MATNRTPREIAGELEDCAVLFKEHVTWQSTLMATTAEYLADMARDNATRYLDKAVALRGAA